MILHLAMFTWRAEVSEDDVQALTSELRQMAADIPELASYHCGPNLHLRPGGADYGVAAAVHTADGLGAYLESDAHKEIYARRLGQMIDTRVAVQLEVPEVAWREEA